MFFRPHFRALVSHPCPFKARCSSCWRPLGAVGEAGKIWAVPNPSSRSDDWLSFQFFKVGGAGLSRWGAWPEVEVALQRGEELEEGQGAGQDLGAQGGSWPRPSR